MANLEWLNIPRELRERPQWAVSTLALKDNGKKDKAPRSPRTGYPVDPTKVHELFTFDECINSGYPAIGYCLHSSDPFTIIDLDPLDKDGKLREPYVLDMMKTLFDLYDGYTETSVSGNGLHLIMEGEIGGGFNRDGIEVYDQERYILCTGKVSKAGPILRNDKYLSELVSSMGYTGDHGLPESAPERYTDDELIERMRSARNGPKFSDLFDRVPLKGEDWSQRDASLAQIIAFNTRNHDQMLRIFRRSGLYRPHAKGKNPQHYESYYLMGQTFKRALLAEVAKDADTNRGAQIAKRILAEMPVEKARPTQSVTFPPGLVGEVASFIYHAANRPVPEIALAGALTFCSGFYGRRFSISNTGLNLYTVLVAPTGRGKEGAASGIDALCAAVRPRFAGIDNFRGPGHIASGQALIRHLGTKPSMFSFLTEFGHMLKVITDIRASASDVRTRQVLLDLFSKSGPHQTLQSSIYSDTEKNTTAVQAPCFAFMGDTTPEVFYGGFSTSLVSEGLLPRFLTIHYDGPRVPQNEHQNLAPPPALVDRIVDMGTGLANMEQSNTFVRIGVEPQAESMLKEFNVYCDNQINDPSQNENVELWNRAHLKLVRLSGLVAVGVNPVAPVVVPSYVEWARGLIELEMARFQVKVESGDIGTDEQRQLPAVVKAAVAFMNMSIDQRANYGVNREIAAMQLIPYGFFRRRLKQNKEFLTARNGHTNAIKDAVQEAIDCQFLVELSPQQVATLPHTTAASRFFSLGALFPQDGRVKD